MAAFGAVLAGRRGELDPPDPLVRAVVAALARGGTRVSELAQAAAISERQLQRRFRATVADRPKTLQRVLRFQRVVSGLSRDPQQRWGLGGARGVGRLRRPSPALEWRGCVTVRAIGLLHVNQPPRDRCTTRDPAQ